MPHQSPAAQPSNQNPNPSEGQGQWGEMPAQALPVGARREVPSWPKKP
jgi:magnesium chelatase subunit I